ncbi:MULTISPECIES: YceI family protein [unclassified Psychrobacter]|uniref:YceI family protein n=1 Tax=unclassified Psychrobacter TaxID=196806 RepID=UPI003FD37861
MSAHCLAQKTSHPFAFLILPIVIMSAAQTSHAASYVINPANTNVRFAIDRFKTNATTGGFYNVKGQLQYDSSAMTGDISLIIPIKSLNTGNQAFNSKLTGPDFFDAQNFPLAQFKSTRWYFNQTELARVDGNLTLHGQTHPISLKATEFTCSMNTTMSREICAGNFTATINRTRWNIDKYAWFGLTKNLNLNIKVEAARK